MNTIFSLFKRKKFISISMIILLTCACGFVSISVLFLSFAEKQAESLDDNYVTVALPSGEKEAASAFPDEEGNLTYYTKDGKKYFEGEELYALAAESPYYEGYDGRAIIGAYIEGSQGLSSGALDPLDYNFYLDMARYNFSVLALECTDVKISLKLSILDNNTSLKEYSVKFKLIEPVSWHKAYDLPPENDTIELEASYSLHNSVGSFPFEVGKTYLVRGFYKDYDVKEQVKTVFETETTEGHFEYFWERVTEEPYGVNAGPREIHLSLSTLSQPAFSRMDNKYLIRVALPEFDIDVLTSDEFTVLSVPEDISIPYFAEYTGDWRDFLETEEGRVWKETIIPLCEINHASAPIILSDNLGTMKTFHNGENYIYEGRMITEEEYLSGAKVCIVSADYASFNGYKVGDKISLDFYDAGYQRKTAIKTGALSSTEMKAFSWFPLTENTRLGIKEEYTIVGTYAGSTIPLDNYSFRPDVIFIPKNSLNGAEQFEDKDELLLNSVIIENGKEKEFEAYMAENGADGYFKYYDQGYSAAVKSIAKISENAKTFFITAILVSIISTAVFCLVFYRATKNTVHSLRLMGIKKKKVFLNIFSTVAVLGAISVVLSIALSALVFNNVSKMVLTETADFDLAILLSSSAMQIIVFVVLGFILGATVKKNRLI